MSLAVRLRVRTADDSADALVISSLPSDAHPYVLELPSGDGQSFDPLDGTVTAGAFSIQVIDAVEGADRVVTAELADADGRQQLLSRRAYIEQSSDGGVTWLVLVAGYVNAVRLVEPVVYEFAIGETRRIEVSTQVFQTTTPGFNNATCRIGGPVRDGFGVQADHGPTQWAVELVGTVADDEGRKLVRLRHVAGWWPSDQDTPDWTFIRGALPQYARDRANTGLQTAQTTGRDVDLAFGLFQGISALDGMEVVVRPSGTADDYVSMTAGAIFVPNLFSTPGFALEGVPLLIGPSDHVVLWWEGALPSVGDTFDLYAQPTDISDANPLHIDMHPVDILTTQWSEAGEPFDAAAAAAVRAAKGANLRWKLRITAAEAMADFQKRIYGSEGLATRRGDDGTIVLFSTRIRSDTLPAITWTNDDLRDADGTLWDLDEQTVANKVTIKGQRFVLWTPDAPEARPMDDIVAVPQTRGADNGDTSTFGTREIVYEIPGTIATDSSSDGDLLSVVLAGAEQIFDRYGNGAIAGELHVLASAEQAELGDEVMLSLPQMPNRTARGGLRVMQVVQKTPVLGAGFDYQLIDSGATEQIATPPTFTLAKLSADSRHVAVVTLTNQAAIAALGSIYSVAFQWAIGPAEPTSGGMLLGFGSPFTDAAAGIATMLRTPIAQAGSTIWVRGQTTSFSQRPSPWTAWQSITLDAILPPTSLTATSVPGDDTAYDLAWTPGEDDVPVSIELQLTADAAGREVARLPVGSTGYRLLGLDTGTAYTTTVRYRASTAQGDVSASASVAFTTGGTAPTLAAPTDPVAVVGRPSNPFAIPGVSLTGYTTTILDGTFGLDVTTPELVGAVVFEVAAETAKGSGTPGTFAEVDRVPPTIKGRTRWRGVAPNDGLKRFLRAKVVRGAIESPYCATQIVDAWAGVLKPEDVPIAAPDFALTYASRASDAGPQLVARIGFTKPTSPYYLHTVFTITPPTGGAFTIEAVDASTPVEFPMNWGAIYTVTATAITTSGRPGTASDPQTAEFGLFTFPGVPQGVKVYDPATFDPAAGATQVGTVPLGSPDDPTGLTLHTDIVDGSNRPVTMLTAGDGRNELENPGFEIAAAPGSGDLVAGWVVAEQTDAAVVSVAVETATNQIRSGAQAIRWRVESDQSVPANTYVVARVESRRLVPMRAGEQWLLRGWFTAQQSVAPPAGLAPDFFLWCRVHFSDGSFQDVGVVSTFNAAFPYAALDATFTVPSPPAGALVVGGTFEARVGVNNTTSAAIATPSAGGLMWDVRADDVELLRLTVLDTEITGNLPATVTQFDGVTQRVIAKGHIRGTARNGAAVTFAQPFQNPPLVLLSGGVSYEPRSLWGSSTVVTAHDQNPASTAPSAAPAATAQYDDMAATGDASGFALRAMLRQKGTQTPQSDNFTGGTLSGLGQTSEATSAHAPASDDSYTANYGLTLHAGLSQDASCTIAFETLEGFNWTTRRTQSYFQPAGGGTLDITDSLTAIVPGRDGASDFRIKIAAFSGSTISCTPTTLTYHTSGSDQYASKTPDADDEITWDAIAVN